jgi:hypothetical protein
MPTLRFGDEHFAATLCAVLCLGVEEVPFLAYVDATFRWKRRMALRYGAPTVRTWSG